MRLAVSNIGWPFEFSEQALDKLAELGAEGIEVAPSKVWNDTWNISFREAEKFRKRVEKYDLKVIGFHSLLYDHPELGLFRDKEIEKKTITFLSRLGSLCADLGGYTLVYGSPKGRKRGDIPMNDAMSRAVDFFYEIAESMEREGVSLCIEPLSTEETDFIDSATQALDLIKRVGHPGFMGQFDTKSLYAANEIEPAIFEAFRQVLVHVHVNDPDLVEVGSTGMVDHKKIGELLKSIKYNRFVSIEQKTIDVMRPLEAVTKSVEKVKKCYLS
ncbi:MAG: sugar phosphate isomerase/epimerase [Deltaproteobacteria bacterium]|nr:sugar phosphate isomerase/epimerase [Deltaproteobacteria bacterium]